MQLKLAKAIKTINRENVVTGSQIRAARSLLRWTVQDLATRSRVSLASIHRAEQTDDVPNLRDRTLSDLKRTFEEAGIEFIGSAIDRPGVRLNSKS